MRKGKQKIRNDGKVCTSYKIEGMLQAHRKEAHKKRDAQRPRYGKPLFVSLLYIVSIKLSFSYPALFVYTVGCIFTPSFFSTIEVLKRYMISLAKIMTDVMSKQ